MGKAGKRTEQEIAQWKRSYVENRGYLHLSDEEVSSKFKELRGQEVSASSKKKNETMLARYGRKSLTTSESCIKGYQSYLQSEGVDIEGLSIDDLKREYFSRITPKQLLGRGSTPEARKQSYQKAIIEKGRRAAILRGLSTEGMTDEDFRALSGLSKRESFAKLSDAEKLLYRRTWKITHLRNYFGDILQWEEETSESLREWYHRYLFSSGRLGVKKVSTSKRGKTGWCETRWGRFFYRSSYERDFLLWANTSEKVSCVEGNLPGIEYSYEGKVHYYFPDFLLTDVAGRKTLIEIKAAWMLADPRTKAKLAAGASFAQASNLYWRTLTEKELEDLDDTFTCTAE